MKIKIYCLSALLSLLCLTNLSAQKVIDGIAAIVGNEPVLISDIEVQMHQVHDLKPEEMANAKCFILDQLMQKKLLLTKAKLDSLKVTEEQVEGELDRRISYFVSQFGSEQKFEAFYNKSIPEFKNEFREPIREQLLIEQMQNKILSNVDITPSEVKKFYKSIPEDSLPYYNTEMEIGQIVVFPKVSKEAKQGAISDLEKIRERILKGSSFSTQAILYSEDPGTSKKGGDLGWQKVSNLVPEFSAAALALKKDSISQVIETKFGYHIIQMIERKGDLIHVRHILLRPKITPEDRDVAKAYLDSLRAVIIKDSMNHNTAAYKFSQDDQTKNRGGMLLDPKTNAVRVPVDELDASIFFIVDKLNVGEISQSVAYATEDGKEAFRLLFLRAKTPPHRANLKDDYPKIKDLALQYKKSQELEKWVLSTIPKIYAKVDSKYMQNCDILKDWNNARTTNLSTR